MTIVACGEIGAGLLNLVSLGGYSFAQENFAEAERTRGCESAMQFSLGVAKSMPGGVLVVLVCFVAGRVFDGFVRHRLPDERATPLLSPSWHLSLPEVHERPSFPSFSQRCDIEALRVTWGSTALSHDSDTEVGYTPWPRLIGTLQGDWARITRAAELILLDSYVELMDINPNRNVLFLRSNQERCYVVGLISCCSGLSERKTRNVFAEFCRRAEADSAELFRDVMQSTHLNHRLRCFSEGSLPYELDFHFECMVVDKILGIMRWLRLSARHPTARMIRSEEHLELYHASYPGAHVMAMFAGVFTRSYHYRLWLARRASAV